MVIICLYMITPTRETNTTNTNPAVIKTCLLTNNLFLYQLLQSDILNNRTKIYLGDQSVITFHLTTLCPVHHLLSSVLHPALQHKVCTMLGFPGTGMFVSYNKHFFRSLRWRPFSEKFTVLKCLAQLCQNLLALAGRNILGIQMWQ